MAVVVLYWFFYNIEGSRKPFHLNVCLPAYKRDSRSDLKTGIVKEHELKIEHLEQLRVLLED